MTPEEVKKLVERLINNGPMAFSLEMKMRKDAASALTLLAQERGELREALRPFAREMDYIGTPALASETPPDAHCLLISERLWNDPKGRMWKDARATVFSYGDLRRARSALKET